MSRLLAITIWNHFSFLIISCALLGYGLSGLWLAFFKRPSHPFYPTLLFTLLLIPCFYIANQSPLDPFALTIKFEQWFLFICVFLLLAIPFFLSGLTINILIRNNPDRVFSLYFSDLLGAAVGCGAFFQIAPHFKEFEWLAIICIVSSISAIFFSDRAAQKITGLAGVCLLIFVLSVDLLPPLKISVYKNISLALRHIDSRFVNRQWDAVSRIDWFESSLARFAPGLSLEYKKDLPKQTGITVDGSLLTAYSARYDHQEEFYDHLPAGVMRRLQPNLNHAAALQVLGGQDITAILMSGPASVDVQTENDILADWLSAKPEFKRVRFYSENPRIFLARSQKKYDRISLSLEGALPFGYSGTDILNEVSLETVEGMATVINKLSHNGWLTIHRYTYLPPRAELRLLVTLAKALENRRMNPAQHLAVFQSVSTIMILVSKSEWRAEDSQNLLKYCDEMGFRPVYIPETEFQSGTALHPAIDSPYAQAIKQILTDQDRFLESSIFNLSPVYDNNPFFYNFLKWTQLQKTWEIFGERWEAMVEAGMLVPLIFIFVVAITLFLMGIPILIKVRQSGISIFPLFYFFWIGLGFMVLEIALFEKLIFFLGEPVYSLAIVLSGLLSCSAMGAGIYQRLKKTNIKTFQIGLIGSLFLYSMIVSGVLKYFMSAPFAGRLVISLVIILIPGILMGIPFPSGVMQLNQGRRSRQGGTDGETRLKEKIALAWCLNGIASVIASVGALMLAQLAGFNILFMVSGLCYCLAFLLFSNLKRSV
ncbi:MAG: hypothetical protein HOK67_24880 [Deltaproteobacteria bacterium]|nr:hypothetical protein [Deltaproteobacteria bacterium]MBT4265833.1 hypothetical protein [Deltaproteobacteria bacterium]MBT4637612.1 hypothetical protein [Deltaproteobacteria bacterium]MBT6503138.1 hypothetical protein [Deltaproteobacteria bacterium]MBT6611220.1 hypothetical protein [Deltaproteobacteria bacterium]